jgi:hypothetical protein
MSAVFWIISVIVVLALAVFRVLRRPQQAAGEPQELPAVAPPSPVPQRAPAKRESFHAVSIRYGLESCEAAVRIAGQRFLAGQAPALPLPDCDRSQCKCRYVHHADRREPHDRRNPWSRHAGFDPRRGVVERRSGANRRQRPWRRPRQP